MVDQIPMRDMARQAPVAAARGEKVIEVKMAVPVRAWIIDGRGQDVEIRGRAVAWTSRMVRILYVDLHGREGSLWWWASAVRRDQEVPILGGPGRPGFGHPAGRGM